MSHPVTYRGYIIPGFTVVNDIRLTTALRKEYDNERITPVLLQVRLTHFKDSKDIRWLSCFECDIVDENKVLYNDIIGEYVMPCYVDSTIPTDFLHNGELVGIDLTKPIEFFFKAVDVDLEVKVLRNGTELRANKGQGRRLHSLSPQAVQLDSFAYIY